MAIIGTNDTATVRVASLPSGAAFDTAANVTVTPPTGFSATNVQAFVNELTDGTVATNVNADLLDGVHGSNFVRNDLGSQKVSNYFGIKAIAGQGATVQEFLDENGALFSYVYTNNILKFFGVAVFDGLGGRKDFTIGYDGSISWNGYTVWHAGNDVKHRSFTVATVPSASSAGAGTMIYVSNESGGAVPAFSDGTNWRRVTDRAIIS